MFFKRLSRSRTNSQSYDEDDDEYETPSPQQQQQQQQHQQHLRGGQAPPSSFRDKDLPDIISSTAENLDQKSIDKMYPTRGQDSAYGPASRVSLQNGIPPGSGGTMDARNSRDGFVDAQMNTTPQQIKQQQQQQKPLQALGSVPVPMSPNSNKMDYQHHQAPDLLTRAFNEAIRPYSDKIEALEQEVHDLRAFADDLEQQRMEIYAWIDKRGLRPDVPPAIAKQMDSTPKAASALNQQLDRKITIVNFDLHRLQDDLNDSISSAHFASAMSKFLPDIQRLAQLQGGPRYAYELVIKLVGNLNSHGGLESTHPDGSQAEEEEIEEDRRARVNFYERMDDELREVISMRLQEGEHWQINNEVRRLENNAEYLKANLGIDPYFPRSLDVLRQEAAIVSGGGNGHGHAGAGAGAGGYRNSSNGALAGHGPGGGPGGPVPTPGSGPGPQGTPPRYSQS